MTMTTTGTGITAREALAAGLCSPSCLLSKQETGRCRCSCGGSYHGLLLRFISAPDTAAVRTGRQKRRGKRGR